MSAGAVAVVLLALLLAGCGDAAEGVASARVVSVADGDTLVLRVRGAERRVRLQGIDAPEYDQPGGAEATRALRRLVEGRRVRMVVHGKDGYGRDLVELHLDGTVVNRELVRRGHAWVYRRYTEDPKLLAAEDRARAERIGLWAGRRPIEPWRWRHSRR